MYLYSKDFSLIEPQALGRKIISNPQGFSREGGSIQYMGREIKQVDSKLVLDPEGSKPVDTKLYERLISVHPELEKILPSSRADAINKIEDEYHSPELKFAVMPAHSHRDPKTRQAGNQDNIARELAYLSKQRGSIGYQGYIDTIAEILKETSNTKLSSTKHEQLCDFNGFSFPVVDEPLTPYLDSLTETIDLLVPCLSEVFKAEIAHIKNNIVNSDFTDHSLSADEKQAVKKRFHRLLLAIAACKGVANTTVPTGVIKAFLTHNSVRNMPYLARGLACLVKTPANILSLCYQPEHKGGALLLLAPVGLIQLWHHECISENALKEISQNLQNNSGIRKKLKDSKVFSQWLVTLDKLKSYTPLDVANTDQALQTLTLQKGKAFFEKLVLIDMIITKANDKQIFGDFIKDSSNRKKDLINAIIEEKKGAETFMKEKLVVNDWVLQQRNPFLTSMYKNQLLSFIDLYYYNYEYQDLLKEALDLFNQFIETSQSGKFIKARQDLSKNPHLQAIHQKYPNLENGWNANFSGFSSNIQNNLKENETLLLSENSWDLFTSGFDLSTCLSPTKEDLKILSLMNYVMDGRNAMLVKKNQKGIIITRAVIIILFNPSNNPALFLDTILPKQTHDQNLFISAAKEIAEQMKLPIYQYQPDENHIKCRSLTLLAGRAPFDFIDIPGQYGRVRRPETTIKGTKIE